MIRCEYSITDSAEAAGRTPPSQSGQPCVPEPSGPQPRPESLTRTIPPIRIRTKVATIVAVTRRRNRRHLGGSAAARRDGIHRAQDTGESSPSSSGGDSASAGSARAESRLRRLGADRLRRAAAAPRARAARGGTNAASRSRIASRMSRSGSALRTSGTASKLCGGGGESANHSSVEPPHGSCPTGRPPVYEAARFPSSTRTPMASANAPSEAIRFSGRDAVVLVVAEDVHRLALEAGEEHREAVDDRAAEDQARPPPWPDPRRPPGR